MRYRNLLATLLAPLIFALGCSDLAPIDSTFDPARDSGRADFSVLGVIGNSLIGGYQNNGYSALLQAQSMTAQIATVLGKEVLTGPVGSPKPDQFVIPGWGDPGSPGTLVLVNLAPPNVVPVDNPGSPVNTQYPGVYNNLGIPGASVGDMLNTVSKPGNPFFDVVNRGQGTQIQLLTALEPTFVIAWAGPNDVLCSLTSGETDCLTPVTQFESEYRQFIDAIQAIPSLTGLVVANIPEVTTVPFATTVPPVVVNPLNLQPIIINGMPVPLLGPDGPLALPSATGSGDLVTLFAIPLLADGIGIPDFLPGGTGQPLPATVIITEAELVTIRQRTEDFNVALQSVALEKDVPVVDVRSILIDALKDGVEVGGVEFATDYIQGGLFSLDGIHPWTVSYGILANAFIDAINREYASALPYSNFGEFLDVNFKSNQANGAFSLYDLAPAIEAALASPWSRAGYGLD